MGKTTITGKLDNGTTYVLVNDPDCYGTTALTTFGAGSRHENPDEHGLAHFSEHMAFKATETRDTAELSTWIETLGGSINAWTSNDQTSYYATVGREHIKDAIGFVADITMNPIYNDVDIESERRVINQEIAMYKDNPDSVVNDAAGNIMFPTSTLGRPILGTTESISNYTHDNFTAFTSTHYIGSNAYVGVCGNFDTDAVVDDITEKYSGLTNADFVPIDTAKFNSGSKFIIDDKEQSIFSLRFETPIGFNKDAAASELAMIILGRGMSSMLFEKIREDAGLCYGISAYNQKFADIAIGEIYSSTTPENLLSLEKMVCDTLLSSIDDVDESMLARAVNIMTVPKYMAVDSVYGVLARTMSSLLVYGCDHPISELEELVKSVSLQDIKNTLANIIVAKKVLVTYGQGTAQLSLDELNARFSGC